MTLSVPLDSRWVALPVRGDEEPGEWAAAAVARLLADRDRSAGGAVRVLLEQTWAALLESLRERADAPGSQLGAAFGLVADDLLPVTVVEAAAHLVEPGRGLDAFVDALVVAPEGRFAEPDVQELSTGVGTVLRVQQLRIVGAGDDAEVQTSVVHAWPGPDDDVVLTLSAWYSSPVEAELSRELVDALVVGLADGAQR